LALVYINNILLLKTAAISQAMPLHAATPLLFVADLALWLLVLNACFLSVDWNESYQQNAHVHAHASAQNKHSTSTAGMIFTHHSASNSSNKIQLQRCVAYRNCEEVAASSLTALVVATAVLCHATVSYYTITMF
jgi:hypothetical protein